MYIARAIEPPMSALVNWGQVKVTIIAGGTLGKNSFKIYLAPNARNENFAIEAATKKAIFEYISLSFDKLKTTIIKAFPITIIGMRTGNLIIPTINATIGVNVPMITAYEGPINKVLIINIILTAGPTIACEKGPRPI